MTSSQGIVLLWNGAECIWRPLHQRNFQQATGPAESLWRMYLMTGFWIGVFLQAIIMKFCDSFLWPSSSSCYQHALTTVSGCYCFPWSGCSLYAGNGIAGSQGCLAGSNGSSHGDLPALWKTNGRELDNGHEHAFLAARRAGVGCRSYTVLHGFADFDHLVKLEAIVNHFLHIQKSLPKETLEQQQPQGTFDKDCLASRATEERVWSPTMNLGDQCVNSKACKGGRIRCTSVSSLHVGYMDEKDNVWISTIRAPLDFWS